MDDSILTSIKKLLGIGSDYTHYDPDITMHINSVFSNLCQMGVGPDTGFSIKDDSAKWRDFIGNDKREESIKTYVYLKVKMVFDPPVSSAAMDAMKQIISEIEWRLFMHSENFDD